MITGVLFKGQCLGKLDHLARGEIEFVGTQARRLAYRLRPIAEEKRVAAAFQLVFARSPTVNELKSAQKFFGEYPHQQSGESVAWTSFCRALLASAEFRSID